MAQLDASLLAKLRYGAVLAAGTADAFNQVLVNDDLPGEFASTQFTFMFSGPPRIDDVKNGDGSLLTPIGLVQDVQYSVQRQMAPIPEMGNKFYRHVGGRNSHSASITRILTKSGNMMGMLYRWLLKDNPAFQLNPADGQPAQEVFADGSYSLMPMTLDSDLADIPFGIYIVRFTEDYRPISANYWERCMIAGMSEVMQTGQVVMIESMQIVMARNIPAPTTLVTAPTAATFSVSTGTGGSAPAGGTATGGIIVNPNATNVFGDNSTGQQSVLTTNGTPGFLSSLPGSF